MVAYLARTSGSTELYVVPIDGSLAPVELSHPLGASGLVGDHRFTPDGASIVYWARPESSQPAALYVTPSDGGAAPVLLSEPSVGYSVTSMQVTPDGARLVFIASRSTQGSFFRLFSVPLDGSGAPTPLTDLADVDGDVVGVSVSPDASRVVYTADGLEPDVIELFSVPIDGSAASTRISSPLVLHGDVAGFSITPDGERVAYNADQDENQTRELYSTAFAPRLGDAQPSLGPASGGTTVVPTGVGFTRATEVRFGGRPAAEVIWVSGTELHAVTPPYRPLPPLKGATQRKLRGVQSGEATVDVRVSEGESVDTLPAAFTFRTVP